MSPLKQLAAPGTRRLITTFHPTGAKGKTHRAVLRPEGPEDDDRNRAFRRIILSIPPGRVSSYGKVAAAAGYPFYHRAVARLLRVDPNILPWHRVLGAGGEIKLKGDAAREQRARLTLEGVLFHRKRVPMDTYEHLFRPWELPA